MNNSMGKVYLHADMDAFFASVEQRDNPQLKNKPVIVGGLPNQPRSVVCTASYEAREYGVHSAMSSSRAFMLCPNGIFIKPRMKHYRDVSAEIMEIFSHYSPDVFQMSIDEALIDLTGTDKIFGNPVNAARKIKQEVWEKTHLTISIGLATTKYIAKIASGMKKPNGLTVIPRGKEEEFILSLPLEELWGVGKKTLAKIKAAGFLTTRALHDAKLDLLQTNFGKACGLFLFNATHALEVDTFASKPLTHSVSAERTFPFDLTDKDVIDAKLQELSSEVMFRLYDENKTGKTVGIKVRYDDFTTFSAQITHETYVSSSDDLYFKVKKLFWDKINSTKAIRLLGVNVQNVEDDVKKQEELFDFGDEKKRKLDRVIFELQKKDSSIKIVKASILSASKKSVFLLCFSLFLLANAKNRVYSQTKIVNDDENVEFDISGYWNSSAEFKANLVFDDENGAELQTSTPVFTQDVDMSLYFLLNRMWFFSADFKDEFSTNTIAAGYIGNGYLKEAKAANRGIEFPNVYGVNLFHNVSGGKNEAPGVSLHFAGEKWQADTIFRYDLVKVQSKTFYGNVAEESESIQPSDFVRGYRFVLPDDAIKDVADVFVESDSGSFRWKNRRFQKLNTSDYLISRAENTITLASNVKSRKNELGETPVVIVSLNSMTENSISALLGSYNDENSFLGDVQKVFSESEKGISLDKYAYDYLAEIENKCAIVVQNSTGFSPFAADCFYDVNSSQIDAVSVVSESTQEQSLHYFAEIVDDINEKDAEYIEIYVENNANSLISAASRFPFADTCPEIYLGLQSNSDFVIQATIYSETTSYFIGKNASSVMVYVNGVLDSAAIYDETDGNVQPSVAIGQADKVYIVYYEENGYSSTGSLAVAGGFLYDFSENLSADVSLAAGYSYSPDDKCADAESASPAYALFATAAHWKSNDDALKVSAAVAVGAESNNTTGLYRIFGGESDECETISLDEDAACDVPEDFSPQINARPDGESASAFALPLELSAKQRDSSRAQDGVRDSAISGYAVPILWDFSNMSASVSSPVWSATTIELGKIATSLASAQTFSIALKCEQGANVEVFLQLGVNTDENFAAEDTESVPTWLISAQSSSDVLKPLDLSESDWQNVTVRLCDEDKAHLGVYTGARIIILSADTTGAPSGKISAGVFEIAQSTFLASANGYKTTLREDTVNSINAEWALSAPPLDDSAVQKLNTTQNIVSALHWKKDSPLTSLSSSIEMSRYIAQTDFSNYKTFALYYYFAESTAKSVSFALTRGNETAISFDISREELGSALSWHKIEVNLLSESVYIDGEKTSAACKVDTDVIASKISIILDADGADEGYFFIDELHLATSLPVYSLQDNLTASYDVAGTIFAIDDAEILHDFSATATTASVFGTKNFFTQSAQAKVGLSKLDIAINETTRDDSKYLFSAIGHSIKTNDSIFDVLDLKEEFQMDNEGKKNTKGNQLSVKTEPFSLDIRSETSATQLNKTQDFTLHAESDVQKLHFDTETAFYQKVYSSYCADYRKSYIDNTKMQFSTGDAAAKKRKSSAEAALSYAFTPLSFTPEISATASDTYTASSSAKQSEETAFQLTLPITISRQLFSLSYTREGGSTTKVSAGGDYRSDVEHIAYSGRGYFYTALIGNDLFSDNLASSLLQTSSATSSTHYYYATYEASWKRPNYYTLADVFIPSVVNTSFARHITASSTQSDTYNAKASLTYSFFNLFGSYSALHLFSWYTQDEFYTILTSSAKIPRNQPSEYTLSNSATILATFTLNKTDSLKSALDATIEDADTWSAKGSLTYKRRRKTSPIVSLVQIFKPNLDTKHIFVTRADSIKLAASEKKTSSTTNAKTKKTQSVIYTHSSEVTFSSFLKIGTSVSPEFSRVTDGTTYVGISATLSATLSF